jgi:hypothetical protein
MIAAPFFIEANKNEQDHSCRRLGRRVVVCPPTCAQIAARFFFPARDTDGSLRLIGWLK